MILEGVIKAGNVKSCKALLRHSSAAVFDETDKNGRTPLMLACFNGNIDLITLLINNGAGTANKDNVRVFLFGLNQSPFNSSLP